MILCFDIGGTAIKAAFASSAKDIRPIPRVTTPLTDFSAFASSLHRIFMAAPEKPHVVSLSLAAVSDPQTGLVTCANIPAIDGRNLSADLTEILGCPVIIANDADCFVLAEAGIGAGQGHRIVFGIILGTGVGGGLAVDGRLINQDGGFAGEWGHGQALATMAGDPPVAIPQLSCGCGQTGCVDTLGAARGLERLHKHLSGQDLSSESLIALWLEGNNSARRTLDIYVELLSAPLALAINITGASIVPVGGGLSNVPALLAALDKQVRARTLRRFQEPLVVKGQCELEPGIIGAVLNGLQFLKSEQS